MLHRTITIGLLLPPFQPRQADALPFEVRPYALSGRERPHTRPSRAAALVRLARVVSGEVLLDPCGGIGVVGLEAAGYAAVEAISLDLDEAACAAAEANVRAAHASGALRGRVRVLRADAFATGLPPKSVDVAIADLPFGLRHAKLDVALLLKVRARRRRRGGSMRALSGRRELTSAE